MGKNNCQKNECPRPCPPKPAAEPFNEFLGFSTATIASATVAGQAGGAVVLTNALLNNSLIVLQNGALVFLKQGWYELAFQAAYSAAGGALTGPTIQAYVGQVTAAYQPPCNYNNFDYYNFQTAAATQRFIPQSSAIQNAPPGSSVANTFIAWFNKGDSLSFLNVTSGTFSSAPPGAPLTAYNAQANIINPASVILPIAPLAGEQPGALLASVAAKYLGEQKQH